MMIVKRIYMKEKITNGISKEKSEEKLTPDQQRLNKLLELATITNGLAKSSRTYHNATGADKIDAENLLGDHMRFLSRIATKLGDDITSSSIPLGWYSGNEGVGSKSFVRRYGDGLAFVNKLEENGSTKYIIIKSENSGFVEIINDEELAKKVFENTQIKDVRALIELKPIVQKFALQEEKKINHRARPMRAVKSTPVDDSLFVIENIAPEQDEIPDLVREAMHNH